MPVAIATKVANFFASYPSQHFDKRQLILHADQPLPGVFYLIKGQVSQFDIAPNGNEIVVNVFKPGAFFPVSVALNRGLTDYFFEAETAVEVKVAPTDKALQFLVDNPDVALDLLKRVYRGMDGVLRRMTYLMGGSAKTRLVFEILNIATRFGEVQPDGRVRLPVHEGDLAKRSGLARETVSRLLQELKATQLVAVEQRGIVVVDIAALESRLYENP